MWCTSQHILLSKYLHIDASIWHWAYQRGHCLAPYHGHCEGERTINKWLCEIWGFTVKYGCSGHSVYAMGKCIWGNGEWWVDMIVVAITQLVRSSCNASGYGLASRTWERLCADRAWTTDNGIGIIRLMPPRTGCIPHSNFTVKLSGCLSEAVGSPELHFFHFRDVHSSWARWAAPGVTSRPTVVQQAFVIHQTQALLSFK